MCPRSLWLQTTPADSEVLVVFPGMYSDQIQSFQTFFSSSSFLFNSSGSWTTDHRCEFPFFSMSCVFQYQLLKGRQKVDLPLEQFYSELSVNQKKRTSKYETTLQYSQRNFEVTVNKSKSWCSLVLLKFKAALQLKLHRKCNGRTYSVYSGTVLHQCVPVPPFATIFFGTQLHLLFVFWTTQAYNVLNGSIYAEYSSKPMERCRSSIGY
jgi:hypothetical protein